MRFAEWFDGADDPALGCTREDFIEHTVREYSTFRWLFEPLDGLIMNDLATAADLISGPPMRDRDYPLVSGRAGSASYLVTGSSCDTERESSQ